MSRLTFQNTYSSPISPQRGEKRKSPVRHAPSGSDSSKRQKLSNESLEVTSQQQGTPSSQNPSVSNIVPIAESFRHIEVFKKKNRKKDTEATEQQPNASYIKFEFGNTESHAKLRLPIPKGFKGIREWAVKSAIPYGCFNKAQPNMQGKKSKSDQEIYCPLNLKMLIKLCAGYQDKNINGNTQPNN